MPRAYLITFKCLKEFCKRAGVPDESVCCAYCELNIKKDKVTGRLTPCLLKCKNIPQLCGRSKRVEM